MHEERPKIPKRREQTNKKTLVWGRREKGTARVFEMAAEAPDGALDKLIAAVVQVKITEPAATSKQVHEILARDSAWADVGFSLVKKACSKAAKMGAITRPGQAQGQGIQARPLPQAPALSL